MPRVKSVFMTSPTRSMRLRGWVHLIDNHFRSGSRLHIKGPLSNRKRTNILFEAIGHLPKAQQDNIANLVPGSSHIKWSEWLAGRHRPTKEYIDLIESMIPGSGRILDVVTPPLPCDPPIVQFLYAVDQWVQPQPPESALFSVLQSVHASWRPVKREPPKVAGKKARKDPYWSMNALPHIRVIPSVFLESYRVLEPSSIVSYMLRLAGIIDFDHDEKLFTRWVFDLVSASLVTATLLRNQGVRNVGLGGLSEDATTCALWHFLEYQEMADMLGKEVVKHVKESARIMCEEVSLKSVTVLSATPNTIPTLQSGKAMLESELRKYGITVDDILQLKVSADN